MFSISTILFVCFLNSNLFTLENAFSDGARGLSIFAFLKTPTLAYFKSIGDSGSAVKNEDNIFLNPASAYSDKAKTIFFSISRLGVESTQTSFAYLLRDANYINGFSFSYIDYGDFLKINENAEITGSFSPRDFLFSYTYSFGKTDRFGIRVKYVFSNMIYERYSGFALDLGFISSGENSMLSFVVRNIGPSVKAGNFYYSLPLEFDLGFSYVHSKKLRSMFDYKFPIDNKSYASAGFEYVIYNEIPLSVKIRGGVNTLNFREIGWGGIFTTGFGIEFDEFALNYAFVPYSNIDSSHFISLRYKFGEVSYRKEQKKEFDRFVLDQINLKKKLSVFTFKSEDVDYANSVASSIEEKLLEKKLSVITRLDPLYITHVKPEYEKVSDVVESAKDIGVDYAVWGDIKKLDDEKVEIDLIFIDINKDKVYKYRLISDIYDIRNISLKISDVIMGYIGK